MEISSDPLEEHQEFVTYLMLTHMSSFSVNTYLQSILGHLTILEKDIFGPLNENQREQLNHAFYSAERLHEHLNVFITASRLLFTPDRYYLVDHDLLQMLKKLIERVKAKNFEVKSELPAGIPEFKTDGNLLEYAIRSIGRLFEQIHPTRQGFIQANIKFEDDFCRILFLTNKEEAVYPLNQNPDLFIVQAVARLHGGEFIVENEEDHCLLTLTLSMTKFS